MSVDLAEESARVEIEDVNHASPKFPTNKPLLKPPILGTAPCHTPRRLERALACEASDECSVGLEISMKPRPFPATSSFLSLPAVRKRRIAGH